MLESLPLLLNTVKLWGLVSLAAVPLSTTLAFFVARTDLLLRRWIETLLIGMLFVPAVVHVAAWEAGFGLQGWVSQRFGPATILLDGWTGAVWVYTMYALPWLVLIQVAFFRAVPRTVEEQALLEMSPCGVFFRITLPLAAPGIVCAVLWVLLMVANEITITDVYQIRTYAEEIYAGFALGDSVGQAQVRFLPGAILLIALLIGAYRLSANLLSVGQLGKTG